MSTFTKYKKIEKPLAPERYSIDIVNKNNDIIDSELHKLELKDESQDNLLATKEALNTEISRAAAKENAIENSLNSEISRAQTSEIKITNDLAGEISRAEAAESSLNQQIAAETERAAAEEISLQTGLAQETKRASDEEKAIGQKINTEAATLRALIDTAYASANGYTDEKIAGLINGAPSTLDTLKEIADALESNETVVGALNDAIGTKANQNELDLHTSNADIHVTATDKAGWNNPVFTQTETRENISSGESTPTLWGKVKKFFSDLKAVAFSGSYNDLSDKPTIPTVGNGTVTIKQAGISKGTFTMNQSGDTTIELTDNNTTYTHPATSGNKHIPSGGASGQILKWSADGTAVWGTDNSVKETSAPTFATLADFWKTIETLDNHGAAAFIRCKATGSWCPFGGWFRAWVTYQNRVGNGKYEVTGSIFATQGNMLYLGTVGKGQSDYSSLTVSWTCLTDYIDNADVKKGLLFGDNKDGSHFTLRPHLPQNILQITKNDAIALFNVYSNGMVEVPQQFYAGSYTGGIGYKNSWFGSMGYGVTIYGYAIGYTLGNNTYRIDIKAKIHANSMTGSTSYNWGFNLTTILQKLGIDTSLNYGAGTVTYYKTDGTIFIGDLGYSGTFGARTISGYKVLIPARYYTTSGSRGEYATNTSMAAVGVMYDATIIVGN